MAATVSTSAAAVATNKSHLSSSLLDKPFFSPSQKLLSLAAKTLPKPYHHPHRTLITAASKNPLTDVVSSCKQMAVLLIPISMMTANPVKSAALWVSTIWSVGVAHNGNLVNYKQLHGELEENGSIFNTSSDTEGSVWVRPLVMGRRSNGAVVFASETCALDLIEATYEREVLPGEVVVVDKEGVQSICLMPHPEPKSCIFEHIYFALPNSVVFGSPVECDVVIAVPGWVLWQHLVMLLKQGFHFNRFDKVHYVGRTFIEPSRRLKFGGDSSRQLGQCWRERVVVVDSSIVRGRPHLQSVRLLKEAEAKEGSGVRSGVHWIRFLLHSQFQETNKLLGSDSKSFVNLFRQLPIEPTGKQYFFAVFMHRLLMVHDFIQRWKARKLGYDFLYDRMDVDPIPWHHYFDYPPTPSIFFLSLYYKSTSQPLLAKNLFSEVMIWSSLTLAICKSEIASQEFLSSMAHHPL
ncbi:hypothetical protein HAX54_009195 [Datura stramonium]|uniref:Uncharacterized protein n=1 Tax=Datura stramonium TaxID=4076 RepID=A0ABS8RLL6_DATST|nr:hypothetical protein [Datura stramonium]